MREPGWQQRRQPPTVVARAAGRQILQVSSLLTDLTKQLAGAIAEYQLSTILNKVLTNFQNDKPDGPALREIPGSEIIHLTLRTDGERDDV